MLQDRARFATAHRIIREHRCSSLASRHMLLSTIISHLHYVLRSVVTAIMLAFVCINDQHHCASFS